MRGTRADGHLLSVRCAVDSLNLISQSIATLCAPFYNASRTRVCPAPRRLTDASPCQSHVTSGSGRRLGGSREVGEWGEVRGGGRVGVGGQERVYHQMFLYPNACIYKCIKISLSLSFTHTHTHTYSHSDSHRAFSYKKTHTKIQ